MRSLSVVVMSQIKLIPTPSWLVYFVLKAQHFFINFGLDLPIPMFTSKDLSLPWSGVAEMFRPYLQTLDLSVKACQGKTLQLLTVRVRSPGPNAIWLFTALFYEFVIS